MDGKANFGHRRKGVVPFVSGRLTVWVFSGLSRGFAVTRPIAVRPCSGWKNTSTGCSIRHSWLAFRDLPYTKAQNHRSHPPGPLPPTDSPPATIRPLIFLDSAHEYGGSTPASRACSSQVLGSGPLFLGAEAKEHGIRLRKTSASITRLHPKHHDDQGLRYPANLRRVDPGQKLNRKRLGV